MKRLFVLILIMLTAAIVFAQTPEAVIREMTGTVELKAGGSGDWKPAKPGDRLSESTMISTGFRSTAILVVGNSTMAVRPLTRLSLQALLKMDNTETINVGLTAGRIQVDVKPPAGSRTIMTVSTPMATASVRGTIFDLDPVNITVREGNVSYKSTSGSSSALARAVNVGVSQSSQVNTTTGQAANPYTLAEANRSLPPLPGKMSTPGSDGAALKVPQGNVSITVPLTYDAPTVP